MAINRLWNKVFLYVIGTLTIASFSFYNGLPFINGDTSSYLNAAWENTIPYERPVFYGWFLKISSFNFSLWLSILIQCFIVLWIILQCIHSFTNLKTKPKIVLALILALTTSHLGWESNKLLPDVFAGLTMLLVLLYLESNTKKRWTYLLLIILFGTLHNTYFLLYFLLASILLVRSIWSRIYNRKKMLSLFVASFTSLSLVTLSNYIDHGKLELGQSSEVFLVGQAAESGLLYDVLCKECDQKKWRLCVYKDSLPLKGWQYVWNANSPVTKLGGWDALKDEHSDILSTLYLSPKYWPKLITSSIVRGISNCFQLDVGDGIFRYESDSNIQQTIAKYYPTDKPSAAWTKQQILTIPFSFYTIWYLVILAILSIAIVGFWSSQLLSHTQKNRLIFCLISILLNGWTVAQFANIGDRLNTRLFWILPFIMMLILLDKVFLKKEVTNKPA